MVEISTTLPLPFSPRDLRINGKLAPDYAKGFIKKIKK